MLQIAICDDNQNDLSAMEQLITQYRETKIEAYETNIRNKRYQIVLQNHAPVPIARGKEHEIKQRFLEYQMGKGQ